jgi:hypothetical protein
MSTLIPTFFIFMLTKGETEKIEFDLPPPPFWFPPFFPFIQVKSEI